MSKENLLDCPYCGGKVVFYTDGSHEGIAVKIYCPKCGVSMEKLGFDKSELIATITAAWNNRICNNEERIISEEDLVFRAECSQDVFIFAWRHRKELDTIVLLKLDYTNAKKFININEYKIDSVLLIDELRKASENASEIFVNELSAYIPTQALLPAKHPSTYATAKIPHINFNNIEKEDIISFYVFCTEGPKSINEKVLPGNVVRFRNYKENPTDDKKCFEAKVIWKNDDGLFISDEKNIFVGDVADEILNSFKTGKHKGVLYEGSIQNIVDLDEYEALLNDKKEYLKSLEKGGEK